MSNTILKYLQELQTKTSEREKERATLLSRSVPSSERVFVCDSREPNPYYFKNSYKHCLKEGDYTIDGFEGLIAVERKSLDDLTNTLIHNKERFQNELQRLTTYEAKCVVIESSFEDIVLGRYVSKALPQSVIGLMASCSYHYSIPFFFLDNFALSNRFVQNYLLCFARKKENNYNFPAPAKPLELRLEDTILSYSLDEFTKEVTTNKIDFRYYLNQLKAYSSSAIVLQCNYSQVINRPLGKTTLEDIITSIIIDHKINVYCVGSKEMAQLWIKAHLKRYLPVVEKIKKPRKKRAISEGSLF